MNQSIIQINNLQANNLVKRISKKKNKKKLLPKRVQWARGEKISHLSNRNERK